MKGLMGILAAAVLLAVAGAARAEDFSVHLEDLVDVDAKLALPDYKLEKVLVNTEADSGSDIRERIYDVMVRFKDFGDFRLDEAREAGPATGETYGKKGMMFPSGLDDLDGVKTGWIKDSPDLFIMAWVSDYDGRGNNTIPTHSYVILRLAKGKVTPLIRHSDPTGIRTNQMSYEWALEGRHYSYEAKAGRLIERVIRHTWVDSHEPTGISHRAKDEDDKDIFRAEIEEEVVIQHRYEDGKLSVTDCTLTYKTQKDDALSGIARFYLGALATTEPLLDANPDLGPKPKDDVPVEMTLPAGEMIRIPVPAKWLLQRYNRQIPEPEAKASTTRPQAATRPSGG